MRRNKRKKRFEEMRKIAMENRGRRLRTKYVLKLFGYSTKTTVCDTVPIREGLVIRVGMGVYLIGGNGDNNHEKM